MDLILLLLLMMPIGFVFIGILFFALHRGSFRNVAHIARQTGKDINDVYWVQDKFKVRNVDGNWEIHFLKIRDKTKSIDGSLWTKFVKPKYQKKLLKYSKDEWDQFEIGKHIQRGLYFFETREGQLYPLTINDIAGRAKFNIVDQDNLQFISRETQDINSLTRSRKKDSQFMWGIIIGVIVLGCVFGIGGYYMHSQDVNALNNEAAVCSAYAKQVFNVTLTGAPQYLPQPPNIGG